MLPKRTAWVWTCGVALLALALFAPTPIDHARAGKRGTDPTVKRATGALNRALRSAKRGYSTDVRAALRDLFRHLTSSAKDVRNGTIPAEDAVQTYSDAFGALAKGEGAARETALAALDEAKTSFLGAAGEAGCPVVEEGSGSAFDNFPIVIDAAITRTERSARRAGRRYFSQVEKEAGRVNSTWTLARTDVQPWGIHLMTSADQSGRVGATAYTPSSDVRGDAEYIVALYDPGDLESPLEEATTVVSSADPAEVSFGGVAPGTYLLRCTLRNSAVPGVLSVRTEFVSVPKPDPVTVEPPPEGEGVVVTVDGVEHRFPDADFIEVQRNGQGDLTSYSARFTSTTGTGAFGVLATVPAGASVEFPLTLTDGVDGASVVFLFTPDGKLPSDPTLVVKRDQTATVTLTAASFPNPIPGGEFSTPIGVSVAGTLVDQRFPTSTGVSIQGHGSGFTLWFN